MELNEYFGKRFEMFVAENILRLFPGLRTVKKEWGTIPGTGESYEIDIVALNEKTKEILFAECKWKERVNAEKAAKVLAEKTRHVRWHNEKRRESLAIFAKSFSAKIKEYEGRRVYCFDFNDIKRF